MLGRLYPQRWLQNHVLLRIFTDFVEYRIFRIRLRIRYFYQNCRRRDFAPFRSIKPLIWWRHLMETFSALLAICAGTSRSLVKSPHTERPVTRSFDAFFELRLNKRLSKESRGCWFETPSRPLWRHCNDQHSRRWKHSIIEPTSAINFMIRPWTIKAASSRSVMSYLRNVNFCLQWVNVFSPGFWHDSPYGC